MSKNKLLFSTPPRGVALRPGTSKILTRQHHHHHHDQDQDDDNVMDNMGIDISKYEIIRLFARNRSRSATCVWFTLLVSQDGRFVAKLDKVKLAPGQSYTQTYSVPGQTLDIKATATAKRNSRYCGVDVVDVQVYGHK
ncbi:hypothetical protein M6D81_30920 [Paenibacillus sp. J5C_2022]|uniref:hypothetical protein n=1 Tax=Paenibacillus sp. J5C2022 TaxID=2977129 RepID=UPI0021D14AAE|nr:hypothetical protein [Paenibacillus sp. J5C2022]MCU6713121.1 hypothetical protein [Paenibacillus sp. J5C2022]